MQAAVLTIAGSDPTGGAGIQADIKTMTTVGVYGAAAITCVTVQNSRGVSRVEPLAPDLVFDQVNAVLEDHDVTHIKTGMIGTAAIAEAIHSALKGYAGELVVDPVLTATTGQDLMRSSGIEALKENLFTRATIITPNLPELSALTGMDALDPENALEAAGALLEQFPNLRGVLVKGGHAPDAQKAIDFLLYRLDGTTRIITSSRTLVNTRNTHGTGCTLASAFAAYHCLTGDDEQAFYNSARFIQQQLEHSSNLEIVRNPDGCGGLLYRNV